MGFEMSSPDDTYRAFMEQLKDERDIYRDECDDKLAQIAALETENARLNVLFYMLRKMLLDARNHTEAMLKLIERS